MPLNDAPITVPSNGPVDVERIGHGQAAGAGLVLHDDGRIAGNVRRHVARKQPGIDVVARADADADDEAQRLALEERGDVVLREGGRGNGKCELNSEQKFSSFFFLGASRQPRGPSSGSSGSFTGCLRFADRSSALVSIRRLCASAAVAACVGRPSADAVEPRHGLLRHRPAQFAERHVAGRIASP